MNKPATSTTPTTDSKSLYPAQQYAAGQRQHAPPMSEDERVARALQAQYDREAYAQVPPPVLAQPGVLPVDMPFNCGHCGLAHLVRNATHNTVFQCTRCGRQNQIAFQGSRPVVILRSRASWVPIPIFCNIQ